MAIYHLNARGIAPARGSSAVASAAYQSGETLRDEITGDLKRYARAERIADTGIILPDGAPAWDRQNLWNEAQRAYGGGNELVAKRYEFALPRELDLDEQRACVLDFCGLFKGRACDWAIHDSGDGNPHAHVLVSALKLGADGFERPKAQKSTKVYLCRRPDGSDVMVAAKDWKAAKAEGIEKVYNFRDGERRTMSQAEAQGLTKDDRKTKTPVAVTAKMDGAKAFDAEKAELKRVRASWAQIANKRLAEHAARRDEVAVTIDHRSFEDRKIEYVPTVHEGQRPTPERVAINVEARETNRAIDRVLAELRQLKERAAAWWHQKTDAVTQRRRVFIARHTGTMRATAARKRSMAMGRTVDLALDSEIAKTVEAEIQQVFARRSNNHFNDLAKALAKQGVDMGFADGKGDLKFSKDGRTVTGAQMGRPMRQLMAMSQEAGRPVTAEQLRAMTAEQRNKLVREQAAKTVKVQRPLTVEVEIENTKGIHH
ncbi:MobA/MobL family protein [Collinsella bouchesdurhonensis]|uniref:MobA/MobL family protein n=1 Tax=Collinsella bouchesdurhonensis TaxID=1907654 RepID=UPI00096A940E|nr:MobA/MobL family protein [Collinsella bouchesdurhonensis]